MLHLERGQSLYSSAVKEYFFPIAFSPCSCLLCYPKPRGMLRPKSKQISRAGFLFSVDLLPEPTWGNSHPSRKIYRHPLGWEGRGSWVAEHCWAPDPSADGDKAEDDDSWNAGYEKSNWPGCDWEMPALQRRISTWAAENFSRAALPSSLFGSKSHLSLNRHSACDHFGLLPI